jgi:hypothetical protein
MERHARSAAQDGESPEGVLLDRHALALQRLGLGPQVAETGRDLPPSGAPWSATTVSKSRPNVCPPLIHVGVAHVGQGVVGAGRGMPRPYWAASTREAVSDSSETGH